MVAATLVNELRREQTAIADQAAREMLANFGALNFKAIDLSSPGFIDASIAVAERSHREAAGLGADMYLSMRRDAGVAGQFTVERSRLDREELRHALIVLGPVAAKKLMARGERIPDVAAKVFTLTAGRVSKSALAGTRDTISRSSNADPLAVAYARQTSSTACDFCVMLAGNTYKSAQAAMFSSGTRKRNKAPQPAGEPFHDHCKCALVTIFQGQLPGGRAGSNQFSQAWYEATQQGLSHTEFMKRTGLAHSVETSQ